MTIVDGGNNKWSNQAWETAYPVYLKILGLPFLKELSAGTLPREKFLYYLNQDALYLPRYSRVLAHAASRMNDTSMTADYLHFASEGIATEKAMHEKFLFEMEFRDTRRSKACLMYTSLLEAQSYSAVEVEAASTLPCFWIYQMVGKEIYRNAVSENPYSEWINTYADPKFEKSTKRAIGICDRMADLASKTVRDQMTEIFLECTRMEYLFWESAYKMEKWEI